VVIAPPRPIPSKTRPGSTSATKLLPNSSCVSHTIPTADTRKLLLMTIFGPTLGNSSDGTVVDERTMPATIGRNARPPSIGE
jgi:hypothetical protein